MGQFVLSVLQIYCLFSTIFSHIARSVLIVYTARSHIVLPDLILYCPISYCTACSQRELPVIILKKKFIYKNTYTVYSSNMQSQSQLPLVTPNWTSCIPVIQWKLFIKPVVFHVLTKLLFLFYDLLILTHQWLYQVWLPLFKDSAESDSEYWGPKI